MKRRLFPLLLRGRNPSATHGPVIRGGIPDIGAVDEDGQIAGGGDPYQQAIYALQNKV